MFSGLPRPVVVIGEDACDLPRHPRTLVTGQDAGRIVAIGLKDNKRPRAAGEFDQQLKRQTTFLHRSCKIFDDGEYDEAIRLAVTLRVLLHQTKQSTSLLDHMGIKHRLNFIDTGIYRHILKDTLQRFVDGVNPGATVSATNPADVGLVEQGYIESGQVGWYAPLRLRRFPRSSPFGAAIRDISKFDSWWNDPLVETTNQKLFSRANLVLIMANQDGGGHVDAGLDADYQDLCIDPLGRAEVHFGPIKKAPGEAIRDIKNNVAFASIRQIAYEFLTTIERYEFVAANPGLFLKSLPYGPQPAPVLRHKTLYMPMPIVMQRPI
jgi:hypothetical protein